MISGIFGRLFSSAVEGLEITPWRFIWEQKLVHIAFFFLFLLFLLFFMSFKDRLAKNRKLFNLVSYGILVFSFLYVGLVVKAQPTTTNIVILLNSLAASEFPLGLYIMEPYIFLSFIFIFASVLLWGRGLFCGWLCPYGALLELLNRAYVKFFPKSRKALPEKVHGRLVYLKHIYFFCIAGASFYSFTLSEYMSEIEPFKTFLLGLNRQWYFVLYFVIITMGSVVIYRAYCRYICPLGAALSLPSFIKGLPLVKLKRHPSCGTCRICGNACQYQAIVSAGTIDTHECLDCLDCQLNYMDEQRCPDLIRQRKVKAQESG
jgi:NosR/NirI family nitrous oxide reductase transcriptional regulator